jgi:multiple antibiotic resistance protein
MFDSFFFVALSTILTVVNPLGALPPFLVMTAEDSLPHRRRCAFRATLVSGGTLAVCALVGTAIFAFYGITMPALKISGGILILLLSIDMLNARQSRAKSTQEEQDEGVQREDIAIFPLGIPLLTGPASIVSVFMLMDKTEGSLSRQASVFFAIGITMIFTYIILSQAHHISRLIGRIGLNVFSRLMGLILASIAIEFMLDGIRQALPGLAGRGGLH